MPICILVSCISTLFPHIFLVWHFEPLIEVQTKAQLLTLYAAVTESVAVAFFVLMPLLNDIFSCSVCAGYTEEWL